MQTPRTKGVIAAFAAGAVVAASAGAETQVFTGSLDGYQAEATFALIGDHLVVTLSNMSDLDVIRPKDVLTGLFFNITSDATEGDGGLEAPAAFEPLSATVPANHSMLFGFTGNAGDVSGEWAFRDDLRRGVNGTSFGISAVSAGGFRIRDKFSETNIWGRRAVGFIDYGLTSESDDPATGIRAVRGRMPLTQSATVFSFTVPEDFELSDLSDVTAHFGTSRRHPTLVLSQTIPAPGVLATAGVGALIGLRRRRRR